MNPSALVLGSLVFFAFSGCLHVAEDRAERDRTVGHAANEGAEVHVADGLAAVRAFAPGTVELWTEAPALRFEIATPAGGGARTWTLRLRNVLPDAEVRAQLANGAALPLATSRPARTEMRVSLELPPGARATFTLSAPDASSLEPWRFAALADVQNALDRVEDIYRVMNDDPAIRFVVFNGDLTERGTDEDLLLFQQKLGALNVPLYATLGNHELGTRDDAFQTFYGRCSFSFFFRGVRFTLLDSASATLDPLVYSWLDGWLQQGRGDLHVVTMHIPPLDPVGERNGAFASRPEANKLIARLAAGHVDLTLYGHVHSYYAFSNGGIPAFISGGGGAIPERLDGIGRHFLAVDVDPRAQKVSTSFRPVD
ncbi:metallophosphoesterase family protein [Pendulispora albinea]|uniref:Metallophosphoesterase n=1 Tax=Pendulispora albinea TaxID=2741071 RepID=A0ABZ2MBA4_9BACT